RRARWERLVREPAKWSGRSRFMEIGEATAFHGLLDLPAAAATRLLLDPDPAARTLTALLSGGDRAPWLLVGPEGGFSPGEVEAAGAAGWRRARLGATALRVETAAVAAAAIALAR
ncbi:MAG: RsmE family RNA methyltransferase, partial [Planctomycetota bacterium]